ncbi:8-oxo-dGTP diphosphatase [Staphylococcus auricularis]|nr:nucleoside triphosphatase YtkD [Staphylococcus auricularis]MBM0868176.1 nucleoside triphosphatase YtkD [Staphylococcus auricularis]MCG7341696.1 nucleoside triphosphatase YtkD [Staphylococcus auricularis]
MACVKFKDKENDDVYLTFKSDEMDEPDGRHVLIIPIWEDRYLFTQHKKRGIEFPGGKVEKGETPIEAMHRELYEETGATVKVHQYIAQYYVDRTQGKGFYKDVFVVAIDHVEKKSDYLETLGPVSYKDISEIPKEQKSYLLDDPAILACVDYAKKITLGE